MTAPVSCSGGTLLPLGDYTFDYSGRQITGRVCARPDGLPPEDVWTEVGSSARVDFAALEQEDAWALHAVHHSINEAFWPKLQDAAATEELEADVWFRVDRSGLPTKSDVGGSAALGAAAQAQLESRIRSAAVDLAGQIRAIPSGTARFRRDPLSAEAFGVPKLRVVATADLLKQIGDLPMVWQILPDPGPFKPHADAYFYVDREDTLDNAGWDGTGRTVALLEYSKPDSTWNLNLGNGTNCTTDAGPAFKCYSDGCPGTFRSHARKVAGIVRSSALSFGGMADDVTTIFANFECDGNITNAINWATDNGASVVNQSSGGPAGSPQNTNDMFLDYKALNFPYPTIVASAGNQGISYRVSNNLRNGIVVGGADDHGMNNRATVTMYGESTIAGSNSANWYGAGGWELPHIVAPAGVITTAGYAPNTTEELLYDFGTSLSAPQLSGIIASLQELNPNLTVYWEPTVPGLMVSANENVDEYFGGVWPLSVSNDNFDDKDGAGLVNAYEASIVLTPTAKRDGGQSTSSRGHDYGGIDTATWPEGTWYSEIYNAYVPNGATLRAAAQIDSIPTCGTPATATNCSANPYPKFYLYIYDPAVGQLLTGSVDSFQNYQFARWTNTSGSAKTLQIKLQMWLWSGLSSSFFGLAWSSRP